MEFKETFDDGKELLETPQTSDRGGDVDLVPIYLREMGATPLLDREGEVELASALLESRKAYAIQVHKLPSECRKHVLNGSAPKPGSPTLWSMEQIESSYERLRNYRKGNPDLKDNAVFKQVLATKRSFDRSRDALIQANLRLVAHVAKKFGNQGLPFMDLVQEGNIGLMKAVEKFDHERGHKFSTYAFWWIKQAITRAIADKARTIRIPVHVGEKIKKIQRASAELEESLGRTPTPKEIARKTRMPVKMVDEILGAFQEPR